MADTPQTSVPDDGTTALLCKFVAAVLAAPKISMALAHAGVTVDPLVVGALISGALHKLHLMINKRWGWL